MATTRPMTASERSWLSAQSPGDPGRARVRMALLGEGFWTLGLGWAALRLALPDGPIPPGGPLRAWEVAWLAASAFLALRWERRRRAGHGALSRRRDMAGRIQADLSGGEMQVRRVGIEALHRLVAPETGETLWLARPADGGAWCLHDRDPAAPLPPRAELEVATAPRSGLRRVRFAGAATELPPARMLTAAPGTWPGDQAWTGDAVEDLLDWFSGEGVNPPGARPASSGTPR